MNNKFKIIETPNYILAVSETAGKIGCLRLEYMPHKPHCYKRIYNSLNGNTIKLFDKEVWGGEAGFTYEIIAYQPKNNAPELDLPLLPEIVVEDEVEIELKNFDSANILDILNIGNINYLSNGDIVYNPDLLFIKRGNKWFTKNNTLKIVIEDDVEKLAENIWMSLTDGKDVCVHRGDWGEGFKQGCKSATKVYSEEDLKEAIAEAWNSCEDNEDNETFTQVFDRIIQSLKQPKTPKWFVAEMEGCDNCINHQGQHLSPDCCHNYKLKTTTINGKKYLVGTYLYE